MKLLAIERSTSPGKKWMAVFRSDAGRTRKIHFGASGMDDYLHTHDKAQRDRYRTRHAKDLQTDASRTGVSAGALSYYILWGDSTSMGANISSYKKRFGL